MGKHEVSFPACCVKFAMSWSVFKPPSGILPMQELSWTGYSTSPKPHAEYERLFPCLFSWVTCLILSADLSFLELISNKQENSIRTGYQFTLHGCHNSIWLVIFSFFFNFERHANVGSKFPIARICSKWIYWCSLTVCALLTWTVGTQTVTDFVLLQLLTEQKAYDGEVKDSIWRCSKIYCFAVPAKILVHEAVTVSGAY